MTPFPGFENLPALAAWLVAVAGPFAVDAATHAATSAAGKAMEEAGAKTWEWLKHRFHGDRPTAGMMQALEAAPEDANHAAALERRLADALEYDPDLLKDLRPLLDELRTRWEALPPEERAGIRYGDQRIGDVGENARVNQAQGKGIHITTG